MESGGECRSGPLNHLLRLAALTLLFLYLHNTCSVIIGKPEKATTYPTLLIMAKDHALIEEGEARAFYIVFDDHNDMLRVIDFVFNYYKKKDGAAAEAYDEDAHSSNDFSLDGDQSDGGHSTQDVNASFASVDTELSLLEESQDIFQRNNLLTNSAIKKESPMSALGSPN